MSGTRIALITGGTDGVGRATAKTLLVRGWNVAVIRNAW